MQVGTPAGQRHCSLPNRFLHAEKVRPSPFFLERALASAFCAPHSPD